MATIQETQNQLIQRRQEVAQARENVQKAKEAIPETTASQLRTNKGLQGRQFQRNLSQAREQVSSVGSEVERYSQDIEQYDQQFQEYLSTDSGKLQYAKENDLEPVETIYGRLGEGYASEVFAYKYNTPYGEVIDRTPEYEARERDAEFTAKNLGFSNIAEMEEAQAWTSSLGARTFRTPTGAVIDFQSGKFTLPESTLIQKDISKMSLTEKTKLGEQLNPILRKSLQKNSDNNLNIINVSSKDGFGIQSGIFSRNDSWSGLVDTSTVLPRNSSGSWISRVISGDKEGYEEAKEVISGDVKFVKGKPFNLTTGVPLSFVSAAPSKEEQAKRGSEQIRTEQFNVLFKGANYNTPEVYRKVTNTDLLSVGVLATQRVAGIVGEGTTILARKAGLKEVYLPQQSYDIPQKVTMGASRFATPRTPDKVLLVSPEVLGAGASMATATAIYFTPVRAVQGILNVGLVAQGISIARNKQEKPLKRVIGAGEAVLGLYGLSSQTAKVLNTKKVISIDKPNGLKVVSISYSKPVKKISKLEYTPVKIVAQVNQPARYARVNTLLGQITGKADNIVEISKARKFNVVGELAVKDNIAFGILATKRVGSNIENFNLVVSKQIEGGLSISKLSPVEKKILSSLQKKTGISIVSDAFVNELSSGKSISTKILRYNPKTKVFGFPTTNNPIKSVSLSKTRILENPILYLDDGGYVGKIKKLPEGTSRDITLSKSSGRSPIDIEVGTNIPVKENPEFIGIGKSRGTKLTKTELKTVQKSISGVTANIPRVRSNVLKNINLKVESINLLPFYVGGTSRELGEFASKGTYEKTSLSGIGMASALEQDVKAPSKGISITGMSIIEDNKQLGIQDNKIRLKTENKEDSILINKPVANTREVSIVSLKPKEKIKFRTFERIKELLLSKTNTKTDTTTINLNKVVNINKNPPKNPVKIKTPLTSSSQSKKVKPTRRSMSELFEIYSRKSGEDILIGEAPTKQKAVDILRKELKSTLRASGLIKEKATGRELPFEDINIGLGFERSKVNRNRIIQSRNRRLGSSGEVFEIKSAKKSNKGRKSVRWFS